jgi:hypothetical protein
VRCRYKTLRATGKYKTSPGRVKTGKRKKGGKERRDLDDVMFL